MRLYKRLIILAFFLSFSLSATEPPLFRRLYIWPNFCLEHLKANPESLSSWSHNYTSGPYLDDTLYTNKNLVNAYFDASLISKTRPYHPYIPLLKDQQCDAIFCKKCQKAVTREKRVLSGNFHDERNMDFPIYYHCDCYQWGITFGGIMKHFRTECPDWEFSTCTPIWSGYFQKYRSPLFAHFIELLQVCRQNPKCRCYWPEESLKMRQILDEICMAFLQLENPDITEAEICNIFFNNWYDAGLYALDRLVAQFSHSFTYSQIKEALYTLDPYVSCWFHARSYIYEGADEKTVTQAHQDFCDHLLTQLKPLLLELHQECFEKHPHPRIERELELLVTD